MPFEFATQTRTAIIGGGISGLAAAYELASSEQVVLFEAESRLGGHARTKLAGRNCDVPVDTGFIVFNYQNYPNLTRMFSELDVPVKKSNMSFAASIGNGAIEYGLNNFGSMTAQTRNMVRPQFWRMISDIVKFNNQATALAENSTFRSANCWIVCRWGHGSEGITCCPCQARYGPLPPNRCNPFRRIPLSQFFKQPRADELSEPSMVHRRWRQHRIRAAHPASH